MPVTGLRASHYPGTDPFEGISGGLVRSACRKALRQADLTNPPEIPSWQEPGSSRADTRLPPGLPLVWMYSPRAPRPMNHDILCAEACYRKAWWRWSWQTRP